MLGVRHSTEPASSGARHSADIRRIRFRRRPHRCSPPVPPILLVSPTVWRGPTVRVAQNARINTGGTHIRYRIWLRLLLADDGGLCRGACGGRVPAEGGGQGLFVGLLVLPAEGGGQGVFVGLLVAAPFPGMGASAVDRQSRQSRGCLAAPFEAAAAGGVSSPSCQTPLLLGLRGVSSASCRKLSSVASRCGTSAPRA